MKYTKVSVSMEGEVFDAPIEFGLDDDLALEGHLEMPEVEMADAAGNDAIDAASDVTAVAAADNQEEHIRGHTEAIWGQHGAILGPSWSSRTPKQVDKPCHETRNGYSNAWVSLLKD